MFLSFLHDMKLKIVLKHFFVFILHLITLIISTEFMKGLFDSHKTLIIIILFCLTGLRLFSLYVLNELPIDNISDKRITWMCLIYVLVDIPPMLYYFDLFDTAEKFGNNVFYGIHILVAFLSLYIILKLSLKNFLEEMDQATDSLNEEGLFTPELNQSLLQITDKYIYSSVIYFIILYFISLIESILLSSPLSPNTSGNSKILYIFSKSIQTPNGIIAFGWLLATIQYHFSKYLEKLLSHLDSCISNQIYNDFLANILEIKGPAKAPLRLSIFRFMLINWTLVAMTVDERVIKLTKLFEWILVSFLTLPTDLI